MLDAGKKNVVGILVNAMDYEAAVEFVVRAAKEKRNATVAAQAIHAIMMGATDPEHQYRLNHFNLILPDAQGVRWGMKDVGSNGPGARRRGTTPRHSPPAWPLRVSAPRPILSTTKSTWFPQRLPETLGLWT